MINNRSSDPTGSGNRRETMTTTLTREQIEETIREKIEELESARTRGEMGDGHWYYACAYRDVDTFSITTSVEASECYSEEEYLQKPGHPVTFWVCHELYSPSPSDNLLTWDETTWEEAEYIMKDGEYHCAEDRLSRYESAESLGLLRGGEAWDDTETQDADIRSRLEAAGWVRVRRHPFWPLSILMRRDEEDEKKP